MPPEVRALTDAQLRALLPVTSPGQGAVDELTRRYGDVIRACVRGLGATAEDARELADEALARTVDACDRGAEPGPCWLVPLLGEARYLAAGRVGTDRQGTVAPGFLHWLEERAVGHDGHRAALADAEEESLLLRSFALLAEPWAAQLWWGLVAPPGTDVPPAAARRTLADAYVRLHVATVAERRCRHLAAALAEQAAEDGPATAEAVRHLARCARCGAVLVDLAAVRRWDADHLRRELLIRFDPPAVGAVPAPLAPGASGPVDAARRPARAARRPGAAGGLPVPLRRWGVGAVAGVGLAVAVLALPPGEDLAPDPSAAGTPTASGPSSPVSAASSPAAPTPAPVAGGPSQSPSPTPSATHRRPGATAAPSRTPTAALPTPAPPSAAPPSAAPPAASAAASATPTASPTATIATAPTPTAVPTAVPTAPTLRRGDTGPDVVRMQDLLIRADCVPESVLFADGGFDDATARFLRSFQRAAGIAGKEFDRREYGPQSRQALEGAGDRAVCSGG
ncbi:peptidoglycan-binding protein [Kitasatospora purpeofusca]|uniref:peptidoglycan-binding domain-containing protein n=1 Tax=Kitasatospora purpeofusca TaxID=67352 RepID=UPI00368A66C0